MIHSTVIGRGPINVVFLHGIFGQGKNFTDIANSLSDIASCRLVDLPNHGRSSWSEFTFDSMVDQVTAHLIDYGALSTPLHLIGHSLGGKVAMKLALSYPRLIEKLIVEDIAPAGTNAAKVFAPWVKAMLELNLEQLQSRREADRLLKPFIPEDRVRLFLLTNLHWEDHSWSWRANLEEIARHIDVVGSWPNPETKPFERPVLWIAGGDSPYIRDEHQENMTALFPNTELVTIEGAGHWVHADQPREFSRVVREFLLKR